MTCVTLPPGTCVPIAAAAVLLNWLGLSATKLVYVESVCRTRSLSVTGALLYPLCDVFVVQWPAVHARFPRSTYVGLLL